MTWIEVFSVLVFVSFALLLPVCYGIADVFAQKSNLLRLEFLEKREEIYNHYPWLESKSRIKRRLKHKEFILSILEDD